MESKNNYPTEQDVFLCYDELLFKCKMMIEMLLRTLQAPKMAAEESPQITQCMGIIFMWEQLLKPHQFEHQARDKEYLINLIKSYKYGSPKVAGRTVVLH